MVPPKQVAAADPLQFMLLDAVDEALTDAGCTNERWDRARVGVIVGAPFQGEFEQHMQMGMHLPAFERTLAALLERRGVAADAIRRLARQFGDRLRERMPALSDDTGSYTASSLSARITKTFDLMGGAATIDAGGASAGAALSACADALLTGRCDMMISPSRIAPWDSRITSSFLWPDC